MPKFGALGCDAKGGFAGRTYVLEGEESSRAVTGRRVGAAGGKWGCFRSPREWGEEETDGLTVQIPHLSHLNALPHPWGPPRRGWRQRDKGSQFTGVLRLPGSWAWPRAGGAPWWPRDVPAGTQSPDRPSSCEPFRDST